jgi:carboxypeptidase family protein
MMRVRRCGLEALCVWLLLAAAAHAATIRGKLVHAKGGAAAGYQVTVSNAQAGRSAPARVGPEGMYFIYNIAPGAYDLEIWVPGAREPKVYRINVVNPYTDVAELRVP